MKMNTYNTNILTNINMVFMKPSQRMGPVGIFSFLFIVYGWICAWPQADASRQPHAPLNSANPREISVFIRVDDIFMMGSDIQPQEIDAFLGVAEKHKAKVVLATIPNRLLQKTNRDAKMAEQLRDYIKRGHQVFQHGFNHKCPFTGDKGMEFYQPKISNGYTKEQRMEKIREGKQMLEAVIGRKVTGYVGPGNDGLYIKPDLESLSELGFLWLPDFETSTTFIDHQQGHFINGLEYTWALKDETYRETMDEAKSNFLETIKEHDIWAIKFHDHFTRKNYNNGIVVRWFDELLTWLDSQPDVRAAYCTYDEYYAKRHTEFSAEF
ncbi:MAG: DUF2334 domain-containing protein [bacterium]|nr:DUF2334 domain-containing protein [Candidatus Sumerlaeota bacterium]